MSVYKHPKTGRWVAQVAVHGRNRQLGTFATQREAKAAITDFDASQPSLEMRVSAWRDRWLASATWKESTRVHNTERTLAFDRVYGQKRMSDITRTLARAWVAEYPSTHSALSAMFGAAIYEDAALANPFSRLVVRSTRRRDLRPDWLTEEDLQRLELAAIQTHGPVFGPSFAAMIRFAAETGVRPGELFVLRDRDLDLKAGALYVTRSADSKTRCIGTPKNGEAREVVLSDRAALAVTQAARFPGEDRIFSTVRGQQFWLPNLTWAWNPVRAAFGRPKMAFYEMRHYCATRLLEMGMSERDVAVQLGHTDGGELVRRVYGHPEQRSARERLRQAMNERAA